MGYKITEKLQLQLQKKYSCMKKNILMNYKNSLRGYTFL